MASALAKRLRWTVVSSLSARLFSTRASSSLSASPYLWSCRERGIFSALAMPMTMKYLKEKHQMLRMLSSSAGPGYDQAPNWSNRPPKETILLDGCDYEHWLIVMEFPKDPKPSEDEMIQAYVKTLAAVVGSEEEAKKKIYSVSTHTYTGFGALISEELSYKVKSQPGVLWVLPDSYIDVPNKDYGGDLFIDGKVIPRPQYRYPERQQGRLERSRTRYNNRRPNMQAVRSQPSSNMQAGRPQTTPMGPRGPVPGSGMQTHDPQQGGNQMSRSRMQHPDVSYQNSGMYSPAGGNGMHNPDASYQNSRVHNPVGGHGMHDPDVSYQNRRMHNPVGGNGMQTERRETSWRGVSHDEAHRMRGMQTERREVPWAGVPNEKANEMDEVYSYSNPIRETQAERREANPTEIPRSEGN